MCFPHPYEVERWSFITENIYSYFSGTLICIGKLINFWEQTQDNQKCIFNYDCHFDHNQHFKHFRPYPDISIYDQYYSKRRPASSMRYCKEIGHTEHCFAGKDPTRISCGNIKSRHRKTQKNTSKVLSESSSIQWTKLHSGRSIHFFNTESLSKVNEVSLTNTATP